MTVAALPGGLLPGLPAGTYYVVLTYLTPWGESSPSTEQSVVVAANGGIAIGLTAPAGVASVRVYYGTQAGAEAQFQQFDGNQVPPGFLTILTVDTIGSPSLVPRYSSAYLPDSDGNYVSAATAYRWLNAALRKLGVQLGGIRDVSGVAWPSASAWAVLSQRWTEIENLWWSGWYQWVGRQEYTWLQNPITSVPGYTTHWSNAGRDIIGLWPQPGSGPGVSTLASPVAITDDIIQVAAVSPFTFPGMFQINNEFIMASSFTPKDTVFNLLGVIRGVGGTVAATHPVDENITQLITMFSGTRLAPDFSPGSAYTLLQLPAGWDVPLDRFMLARFREKEQNIQEARALDQEFDAWLENLRSSKDAVPKDKAVGDGRVYNSFNGYQRSGALPFGILVN
jgi:hypothetical protein